jgi:hypothetical protein
MSNAAFVQAMRDLDGPAVLQMLPNLTTSDVSDVCSDWLAGSIEPLDPTNVLCAGDYADQFLNLPGHAIILYDAALEYMDKHRESIAKDTECAAATLNLIDICMKAGDRRRATLAAVRGSRMPVERVEQNMQLAFWLAQVGNSRLAYEMFQHGKKAAGAAGLALVAKRLEVPEAELRQMEQVLTNAAGAGR